MAKRVYRGDKGSLQPPQGCWVSAGAGEGLSSAPPPGHTTLWDALPGRLAGGGGQGAAWPHLVPSCPPLQNWEALLPSERGVVKKCCLAVGWPFYLFIYF